MENKKTDYLKIIWKTIVLTWAVDKKFVLITIFFNTVMGLIPIALGYTSKLLLDEVIGIKTIHGAITIALISFLGFRYALEAIQDFGRAFLYQYTQRMARFKIQNYLNLQLTEKISTLDIDYFERPDTQNLLKKVQNESFGRIPSYFNTIIFILSFGVTLVGSIIALIPFGIWTPILAVAVAIPRFRVRRIFSNMEWSLFNRRTPANRKLTEISGIITRQLSVIEARIFGARNALLKRVSAMQDHLLKSMAKPLEDFIHRIWIPVILEAALVFFLAYLKLPAVVSGAISIGSLTFFLQMLDQVIGNTSGVNEQISDILEDSLYVDDYYELMNLPPLIKEKTPGHEFNEIRPLKIEFQNVGFSYPNGTKVLKNVSFSLNPGEHMAIVGPNGAGKSTMVKLLLRFYDPTSGSILINDFDLKDLKREHWYKFIGTLFQSFGRYSLTVKENIAFSEIDNPDDKRVKQAAQMSGADEFIEKFKDKYEQQLGREFDGEELSTGQWQKVALARAFYEAAPVLILDEPTSAIDAEAEAEIFDNLDKIYKDKSLILISHRFSTVRHADKIIVLQNGRISEEGDHKSLMAQNGTYARMFRKQAKGYIE